MRLRVVVVDDEAIVALEVAERFRELGHEVVGVLGSGEELVAQGMAAGLDLAVLDIRLRGEVDGIAAAEHARAGGVDVIFITAHGDRETMARAAALTPLAYVKKPFSPEDISAAIDLAVARRA